MESPLKRVAAAGKTITDATGTGGVVVVELHAASTTDTIKPESRGMGAS
jgi:hypothetical protein